MSKSTKTIIWIVVILAIIGIWYSVAKNGDGEKTIKIGLLAPLSEKNISIGADVRNAVELALEQELANLENIEIELVVEDTKCDPAEGVTGFTKLADIDNVQAIVGIVCSGVAEAIGPLAEEKNVPTLLSVAASYKPEKEAGWVFKFWPSNKDRANYEASFIVEDLGLKKIAVIHVNNAFGLGLKEEFEKKVGELGAEIVALEAYNPEVTDFKTNLTKIKDADLEALFIIAYEPAAINILKQAKELDLNTQFLTLSTIISESFLTSIGEIGEGLILDLPITRSDQTDEFEKKFIARFEDKVLHPGTYFASDSIKILVEILKDTAERQKIKDRLYQVSTTGVSGKIEFDEFGINKKKNIFNMLQIKSGQFVPYED
ncbi:ABC transporter substrate-binding protein [Candidatus Falkowbacteria bacterium]|nr:ABC transporter substrate-binding protein [Candidatus Falkowbacteria bacterium]